MTIGEIIEYTQAAIYHELCRMRTGDIVIRVYDSEHFLRMITQITNITKI